MFRITIILSNWIYNFHMPLMFAVSGYVYAMKFHESLSYQIKKDAINLYLPCIYFSLMQWLIMRFIFSSNNPANFGAASMKNLYMLPFEGYKEYWFLAALFFVKSANLFFELKFKSVYINSVFWIIVFIALAFCGDNVSEFVSRLSYGLYFYMGYIFRHKNYITSEKHPEFLYGIILFLAGLAFYFAGLRKISTLCNVFAFFIIFYAANINNSFLVLCGVNSMVIYCLHNFITASFRLIVRASGLYASVNPVILFYICFFFALMIPLFIVKIYKNIKIFRWIEYIFYPGKVHKKSL